MSDDVPGLDVRGRIGRASRRPIVPIGSGT